MMDPNEITHTWYFKSSSGSQFYELLRRANGAMSCNCPGWTRRTGKDGSRTCKHLREAVAFNLDPPSQFGKSEIKEVEAKDFNWILTQLKKHGEIKAINGTPVKKSMAEEFNKTVKELEQKEPEPEDPYARSMNL